MDLLVHSEKWTQRGQGWSRLRHPARFFWGVGRCGWGMLFGHGNSQIQRSIEITKFCPQNWPGNIRKSCPVPSGYAGSRIRSLRLSCLASYLFYSAKKNAEFGIFENLGLSAKFSAFSEIPDLISILLCKWYILGEITVPNSAFYSAFVFCREKCRIWDRYSAFLKSKKKGMPCLVDTVCPPLKKDKSWKFTSVI